MTHHANVDFRPGRRIPVDLAQPLDLTVHSYSGDIAIHAVDRPDVLIAYGDPGDWEDLGEEAGLTITAQGNRIDVRPDPRHDGEWAAAEDIDLESVVGQIAKAFRGGSFFAAKSGKTRIAPGGHESPDITVEVPRSMRGRVEVTCASGDVSIDGFTGEIALIAMSGDVRAAETTGALTLQTASGDLLIKDVNGRLTARAANGDVHVASGRLEGFDIKTASGDIHVEAMLTGGSSYRVQAVSGDVRLSLRQPTAGEGEPAAALAFTTVSGDAHVSPPFRKTGRRRWQSGSGDGGPHIAISTVNGDLAATIANEEGMVAPAPSPAVFPDKAPVAAERPRDDGTSSLAGARPESTITAQGEVTRLALLEAVERGEIDVEEALRRLETVDAGANP